LSRAGHSQLLCAGGSNVFFERHLLSLASSS
jgi:hypothetical protein